ncbi:hypothetical protein R80B4_00270 [Fibrobacteres bacterium R8-0-B4]
MAYRDRLSDNELQRKLDSSGAVLIRGPKSCGKTESAMRFAGSVLRAEKVKPPKSLNVVTGTGISYTRDDGVNVAAQGSLGR